MNILLLNWRDIRHPKSGGAEIVTYEHAKRWVGAGHAVTWLTAGFPGATGEEIIDGIRIIRMSGKIPVHIRAALYYLKNKQDIDVVVDEVHGIPFFTPLYASVPKVVFIHEVAGEIWDLMLGFPLNYLGKYIESIMFFFYKNLLFWTDAPSTIDELVARGVDRKRCFAIPCPISNTPASVLPKKNKLFTCITVSRLVSMKRIEDAIIAFSLLKDHKKSFQLWIVGGGDPKYIARLTKLVDHLGLNNQVTFWGHVDEKKKLHLMRRAHVLVHTSIKEGWGLVVLEAASQGTPSIVYNVSGLRDTVKPKETGIIVENRSSKSLAQAIEQIAHDEKLYRTMQKKGIAWSQSFDWEASASQSLRLLLSVQKVKN